jgi:predicted TIM-barrel fold metal-dependent hydrolase
VIVNHAGMPTDRDDAGLKAWRDGLALLAERPNVSCKISGLAMIDRAWTVDSLRPFVLQVIETFGPVPLHVRQQLPGRGGWPMVCWTC